MNLLFVCSGNTCRSAMAEALAKKIARRRGLEDMKVFSAGTNAWDNATATDEALLVGMERDIDLAAHRARKLTPAIVAEADLIFVMTSGGPANATQITSVTRIRWGETSFPGWAFKGHTSSTTSGGVGKTTYRARTHGHFCLAEYFSCVQNKYPWIDMTVNRNGSYSYSAGG